MADTDPTEMPKSHRKYERTIRTRIRAANVMAWLRAGGIQVVWLIVLVAGAAVPLSEALIDDGWEWLSPTLGFIVVIAAGLERLFSRATGAAVALDQLRRSLAREQRLLLAARDDHGYTADTFAAYVQRSEELLAQYDRQMVEYNSEVLRSS